MKAWTWFCYANSSLMHSYETIKYMSRPCQYFTLTEQQQQEHHESGDMDSCAALFSTFTTILFSTVIETVTVTISTLHWKTLADAVGWISAIFELAICRRWSVSNTCLAKPVIWSWFNWLCPRRATVSVPEETQLVVSSCFWARWRSGYKRDPGSTIQTHMLASLLQSYRQTGESIRFAKNMKFMNWLSRTGYMHMSSIYDKSNLTSFSSICMLWGPVLNSPGQCRCKQYGSCVTSSALQTMCLMPVCLTIA